MAWPSEAGSIAHAQSAQQADEQAEPRSITWSPIWQPTWQPPRSFAPGQALDAPAHYYGEARGLYRIFNAATYRFYRDNAAPPTEADAPFATNATLPHEPADVYANGTWYLSASYFDGVLDSGFLPIGERGETYLRLDLAAGAEAIEPPYGPTDWRIEELAGGIVRVVGFYLQLAGTKRATQWALGYTTNGVDPVVDTPTYTVTFATQGLAVIDYQLPAQGHGVVVKCRLQTRRNDGSWVYSEGSTVKTITTDTSGPTAPVG